MQMEKTFESSLSPFFGGNVAAPRFVAATYHGSDYRNPLNSAANPDVLMSLLASNVMLVKNYTQASQKPGMGDNDIHNQYVDFLVRTALFHREIDAPTSVGSGLENVRKSFGEAARKSMERTLNSFDASVNIQGILNAPGYVTAPASHAGLRLVDIGLTPLDTYLTYINATILMLSSNLNVAAMTGDFNAFANAPVNVITTNNPVTFLQNVMLSASMRNIAGLCDQGGLRAGLPSTGDFCVTALFQPGASGSAGANIAAMFNKIDPANAANMHTGLIRTFTDSIGVKLTEYAYGLLNTVGPARLVAAWGKPVAQTAAELKNILAGLKNDSALGSNLVENITSQIYDDTMTATSAETQRQRSYITARDSEAAKTVLNEVFFNWERLHPDARDFYRVHLNLFRRSAGGSGKWVNVMANGNEPLNLNNGEEYRLNLMKSMQGGSETMFCNTLPFLPNSVKSLWFTDSAGVVREVPRRDLDVNSLRKIYNCVYNGSQCVLGTVNLNLPQNLAAASRNNVDFQLDDVQVIRNYILQNRVEGRQSAPQSNKFEDLYEDMVTRIVYERDEKGLLYRMENNQMVRYGNDTLSVANCLGTRLSGDGNTCSRVRDCILTGNSEDLGKCINDLRDQNLFQVAHDELQSVDPMIALQILKTFGVATKVKGNMKVPDSYESWAENVVSRMKPAVRDAILGNSGLCKYIRGVINFVRTNPAIMNEGVNQKGTVDPEELNNVYLSQLGKRMYINPVQLGNTRSENDVISALLTSSAYPTFGVTLPGQLVNQFATNAVIGPNVLFAPGRMIGGGPYSASVNGLTGKQPESSAQYQKLLVELTYRLENAGITISEADKLRINDGLERLKNLETRIIDLMQMLKVLHDLQMFFKASGCVGSGRVEIGSIRSIMTNADAVDYLRNNINDLQSCVTANATHFDKGCREIVNAFTGLLKGH